jgi:hypothetical protein
MTLHIRSAGSRQAAGAGANAWQLMLCARLQLGFLMHVHTLYI